MLARAPSNADTEMAFHDFWTLQTALDDHFHGFLMVPSRCWAYPARCGAASHARAVQFLQLQAPTYLALPFPAPMHIHPHHLHSYLYFPPPSQACFHPPQPYLHAIDTAGKHTTVHTLACTWDFHFMPHLPHFLGTILPPLPFYANFHATWTPKQDMLTRLPKPMTFMPSGPGGQDTYLLLRPFFCLHLLAGHAWDVGLLLRDRRHTRLLARARSLRALPATPSPFATLPPPQHPPSTTLADALSWRICALRMVLPGHGAFALPAMFTACCTLLPAYCPLPFSIPSIHFAVLLFQFLLGAYTHSCMDCLFCPYTSALLPT